MPREPVRCVRGGVHQLSRAGARWLAGGLLAGGLLAACGGSSPTVTAVGGPKLSGLGATQAQWDAHHKAGSGSAARGTSYGPAIALVGGAIDQFTQVNFENGRVVGWDMAFTDGTTIASAESQVRAQLPADTRQTASRRATFGSSPDTCEIVAFESHTLTTALGAGRGTVGVTLYQIGTKGQESPSIEVVDRATVQVPARPTTAGC